MFGMLAHSRELRAESLLVMGRDAGIQAHAGARLPLAKNPPASGVGNFLVFRGSGHAIVTWRETLVGHSRCMWP